MGQASDGQTSKPGGSQPSLPPVTNPDESSKMKRKDAAELQTGAPIPLRAKGYHEVSWVTRLFFSYVNPLVDKAGVEEIEDNDADYMMPPSDTAQALAQKFDAVYGRLKVGANAASTAHSAFPQQQESHTSHMTHCTLERLTRCSRFINLLNLQVAHGSLTTSLWLPNRISPLPPHATLPTQLPTRPKSLYRNAARHTTRPVPAARLLPGRGPP